MQEEDSTAKKGVLRSHQGLLFSFFPTCQVRVVRFYQSCSPPRLAIFLLLLRCLLLLPSQHLFTSALPTLRQLPSSVSCRAQSAVLDLNLHLPSSVSTAGPEPGTFRAQWAPLGLNGQIECQKICQIERQIECQKECQKICQIKCQNVCPIECQKICQIECQKVYQIICQNVCPNICQKIYQIECQIECHKICQIECQKICQIECQKVCQQQNVWMSWWG